MSITVTVEQGKRLKELGLDHECHFIHEIREDVGDEYEYQMLVDDWYLPTSDELLGVLPTYIDTKDNEYGEVNLCMEGTGGRFACWYYDMIKEKRRNNKIFFGDNLAQALGDLCIRLFENGYLSFDSE